jgi:hypothetical protein
MKILSNNGNKTLEDLGILLNELDYAKNNPEYTKEQILEIVKAIDSRVYWLEEETYVAKLSRYDKRFNVELLYDGDKYGDMYLFLYYKKDRKIVLDCKINSDTYKKEETIIDNTIPEAEDIVLPKIAWIKKYNEMEKEKLDKYNKIIEIYT